MLARRFLWIVAGIVVLVLIAALGYRLFERQLLKTAMVPTVAFQDVPMPPGPTYADAAMWIARPDIPNNPALWLPKGYTPPPPTEDAKPLGKAAVFFIHPTSFLDRSQWNAPIDHEESQQRARLFVRHQASAFNGIGDVWAPKYRQATFGAFLTTKEDAEKALAFAYRDVLTAFDAFLKQVPEDRPIIIAGHSQGSLHATRLLRERVASKPLAKRIAAAYVVGWPISTTADLELLGLPACETAGQAGCILSWQSFAEPADPQMITEVYDASVAPNGKKRAGSPMLCVNPLTGTRNGEANAAANLGTIIPNAELTEGELRVGGVPARCDVSGFLLIGEEVPGLPPYVLPGNNYHVFDYALFWANIRADAEARLREFAER
jgi:pimeloyl-ACP methyl ester carboxylesterase